MLAAQLAYETFRVPNVRVLFTSGEQVLEKLMDVPNVKPLNNSWTNLEEWDHLVSHQLTEEAEFEVETMMTPQQLDLESRAGREVLPLVVVRNGSLLPFAAVEELDSGDQVRALLQN